MTDISHIQQFLKCATPQRWIENALENQELLLIDHANCEKKAASTALNLLYRYTDYYPLLQKLSRLAREELRHFEQVIGIMEKRGIAYQRLSASRYAAKLHAHCASSEPEKLVDQLIIGGIIEARSCERFALVAPRLDLELQEFYQSLLKSEARHFRDYLSLAEKLADKPIENRIDQFLEKEQKLVLAPDEEFRFHSGPCGGGSQV